MREKYNRDGYIILPIGGAVPLNLFANLNRLYHQDVDLYKQYLSVASRLPAIQNLFLSSVMQDIIKDLGIDNPVPPSHPVINVMGLPIPGGYHGTQAHQDWPSVQGSLDMVTVWIPFADIGPDNYPLEVIPGSHLGGLREGKLNGSVLEIEGVDGFIPLTCRAGDVIIMSGFLIHRTGKGTGLRTAASMRFDNVSEPKFIARGFPCAQKRVVEREVTWKPTVEMVRAVYA